MSERLTHHEQYEAHEGRSEKQEFQNTPAEQPRSAEKRQDISETRRHVQEAALSRDEVKAKAEKATHPHHRPKEHVSRETKALVYDRTLLRVRRHLSPGARAASKVIHQKAVEAVSEAAGKTVARPSGLLGGGIVAFIGTGAYYLMTRHYGYDYKSSVFLLLLIGGFLLGWFLEGVFKTFRRSN